MTLERVFSEAFDDFTRIQNENNLIDEVLDGVHVWRLIRGQLFYYLCEEKGILARSESQTTALSRRISMKASGILDLVTNPGRWREIPNALARFSIRTIELIDVLPSILFTTRMIFGNTNKSVLVSAFPRKIGFNHRLTKPIEELHAKDHLLLDKPNSGFLLANRLDLRTFNFIARKVFKSTLSDDPKPLINKIAKAYKIDANTVGKLVKSQTIQFKSYEATFSRMFKKGKISKVFLCWNRYYFALLSAAEKSGISTHELQHGTITPYHIQYAWKGMSKVPYYPDNLLCFGEFWPEHSNLPESVAPKIIGAPHLEKAKQLYCDEKKIDNLVVIFSQKIIGVQLLKFSAEVARLRPDLKFIFKPHPTERYSNAAAYIDGSAPDNLKVAKPNDDSYKLMSRASYQIGVSSTTLNEGMVFENRIVVVPLASWEYLEPAIEQGHASIALTPQQAAELLSPDAPICDSVSSYYGPTNLSDI